MTVTPVTVDALRDATHAPLHFAPEGVFIQLPRRGVCFFRQHLNPGKPTLLLVHGMACTSGLNWFRLFPILGEHFNLIAPDVRGHGRSELARGGFSFERAAGDMAVLLRALDAGPVIAVGYSMGGAIVQHLWRLYPDYVSGLVLAATNYRARLGGHSELLALPFFASMIGYTRIVELFSHLPKNLIKQFLPKLGDRLHESENRWALDEMRRNSFRMVAETAWEMVIHDASNWLGDIDVPTSVVVTAKDRVIPPEHQREMAALIEGASVFDVDDGHMACMNPGFGDVMVKACLKAADIRRPGRRK
jgi:3-oxoadipate enol-lactonase